MNKVDQIREYFREYGPSSAAECARATGISKNYVHKKVFDLAKTGWLARQKPGLYKYHEPKQVGKTAQLQIKMARAMRMCPTWTAFDIAQLSGAGLKYTQVVINFLLKGGYVRKISGGRQKATFRVTPKASQDLPLMRQIRPNQKETKNQKLKYLGWQIMRALRDENLDEALLNCGRLRGMISEAIND